MKFYRRLLPFKAISFDLDDTLYDNGPIIRQAEAKFVSYLNTILPTEHPIDSGYWRQFKRVALDSQPELIHDVTAWRKASLTLGMQHLGLPQSSIKHWVEKALAFFIFERSNFDLPETSIALLNALSKRYPLIAITNGNVNVEQIGLSHYFRAVYMAGDGNLKKPHADMFVQAIAKLKIQASELLHVGDCTSADIQGAQLAGCQSVWLQHNYAHFTDAVLPTIAIRRVTELQVFAV